ncbi:hypothetical protein S40285_07032 [Stachybotrys chlorohalonatus IBT 40285]|uniref:SnoaL-like domain-containing protein n=1 Tax=Stachybotrys chlorohalonatus (strain IBT 40285) TaxID=1283841 RepID=A0A084QTS7_STAC4|nr:hypothetical protein S40285_07032 [Stachybotrys chlorohalonata IBT 40285]
MAQATAELAPVAEAAALPAEEPAAPGLPDYMTDPNAVLKDVDAEWRYGRPPDYSKTRQAFAETKRCSHEPGSLPDLVQNLVKNWEIEASFKVKLSDWRTVDPAVYSFAINGGPPQTAEHMLKVGTYNAIITASNQWYSPKHSDLASSHKTFKRMMPQFAWEVLEVYSGPPVVAFRWRHWGEMRGDYVALDHNGDKVMAKSHGGPIDIQGVTVAHMSDKMQVTKLETWFDPVEMFRQISPDGVVKKESMESAAAAAGCPVFSQQASLPDRPANGHGQEEVEKVIP